MLKSSPIYLAGWLIAATVLLSLASLTAETLPAQSGIVSLEAW